MKSLPSGHRNSDGRDFCIGYIISVLKLFMSFDTQKIKDCSMANYLKKSKTYDIV